MNRMALSGPQTGGWDVLFGWCARMRQRRELAALPGRDLAELGIPPALAAYEAGRWSWQKISPAWREFATADGMMRERV